jgi:1,4-dihydroxy-2-naphthoyl-CoA synthase
MTTAELDLPACKASGEHADITDETTAGIAQLTICRPEVRNAFRPQTVAELVGAGAVADRGHDRHEKGQGDLVPRSRLRRCGATRDGRVNAVVPLDRREHETVACCREMLQWSPTVPCFLQAGLNPAEDGLAGLQQLAGDATMLFPMSEEVQEGRDASVEDRPPDFGRIPRRP